MTSILSTLIDRCCRDIVRRGRQRRRAAHQSRPSSRSHSSPRRSAPPKWSAAEDAVLREHYGKIPTRDIAAMLPARNENSIGQRALKLKIPHTCYYTDEEKDLVRSLYATHTAADIALRIFGDAAKWHCVCGLARKLGLRKWPAYGPEIKQQVRQLHADGLPDRAIADRLGLTHDCVKEIRRLRLKLPCNPDLEAKRRGVANQLKTLGLTSPTQLRTRAYRNYAIENGWPEDLKPREVQILNLLAVRGPMTAEDIGTRIGMKPRWHRTNQRFMHCYGANKPRGTDLSGGTYLALLASRGLVYRMRRYTKHMTAAGPKGRQIANIYTLTAKALELYERRFSNGSNSQAV